MDSGFSQACRMDPITNKSYRFLLILREENLYFQLFLKSLHEHSFHFQYLIFDLTILTSGNDFIFRETQLRSIVKCCFETKSNSFYFFLLHFFGEIWRLHMVNTDTWLCRTTWNVSHIIKSSYTVPNVFLWILFISLLTLPKLNVHITRQKLK